MKKLAPILILSVMIFGIVEFFYLRKRPDSAPINPDMQSEADLSLPEFSSPPNQPVPKNDFVQPLDRTEERVTKKTFGRYITPKNSPVQPERFQGYHTGTDFETFPDEKDSKVKVRAVCPGKLLLKEYASGYGGVAVESCTLRGEPITVVYGHLKLESIGTKAGQELSAGDPIGELGQGYSRETDGERKHLHLGIHKGSKIDIRGYVQDQNELSGWIDPCREVCRND